MKLSKWMGLVVAGLTLLSTGCLVAAAGAGAGGGIYFTQRGAEATVPATIERMTAATERAFRRFKITKTKVGSEREGDAEKREISGDAKARDEDVTVTLRAEGSGSTRVQVVARKTAVTWDKDFARAVLQEIVANAR
jgi:hypothetical protein